MYWNKEIETISRKDLEKLQLSRLQATCKKVYEKVPFYKYRFDELGVKPRDIKSLADVSKLPFTTNDDLRANFPNGLVAVPMTQVVRLHTSSGTTGKPKALYFSKKDLDVGADQIARCLIMSGVKEDDVLQNMMTYGLFTGALVMHYGAEKVGILVIPAGPGNSERQIALMQDFGSTTLHMTPSYALYLADVMEQKGIDPRRDTKLKRAYIGAEPYTEETRKKIEKLYGIDVFNSYGLSEMNGPGVGFECMEKHGLHLWEDNYLVELIDPNTLEPITEDEKPGELVLTTLNREAMPLLRYRTRDITSFMTGKCKCGRTHRRMNRITGRSDDMFILRGVNIFPQQIERILMGVKSVEKNYQIELDALDDIIVRVEIAKEFFTGNVEQLSAIQNEIADKLRAEILVKPKVELMEPGTLPVFEGKAKRVIDKRKL
jgi:phenylacetate-CoA ligase